MTFTHPVPRMPFHFPTSEYMTQQARMFFTVFVAWRQVFQKYRASPPKCIHTLKNYSFQGVHSVKKETSVELAAVKCAYTFWGDTLYRLIIIFVIKK